jgi:hypothetical protein
MNKIKRNDETLIEELNEFARYVWNTYPKVNDTPEKIYGDFIHKRLIDFGENNG